MRPLLFYLCGKMRDKGNSKREQFIFAHDLRLGVHQGEENAMLEGEVVGHSAFSQEGARSGAAGTKLSVSFSPL